MSSRTCALSFFPDSKNASKPPCSSIIARVNLLKSIPVILTTSLKVSVFLYVNGTPVSLPGLYSSMRC